MSAGALPWLWLGINVTAALSAPQRKGERAVKASDRDKRRHTRLPAVLHVSSVAQKPPSPAGATRPPTQRPRVAKAWWWWPFNPNGSAHQHLRPYHQQLASRCCFTAPRLRQTRLRSRWLKGAALAPTRFRRGAAGRRYTTHPWNGRDRRCRPMVSVASERLYVRRSCRPLSTDNAEQAGRLKAKVFDFLCPCSCKCNAGLVIPQARDGSVTTCHRQAANHAVGRWTS
jgi:hypothetical protein